jgi:hypothetical protein
MSSDGHHEARLLEIHGNHDDVEGARTVATVRCPFRGECALAVCLGCAHFQGLHADEAAPESYVVCAKSERSPGPEEALLETTLHGEALRERASR